MNMRYLGSIEQYKGMTTEELRSMYLVGGMFRESCIQLEYVDLDRTLIGSAVPTTTSLILEAPSDLACGFFAERREIGVINLGSPGEVTVGGTSFILEKLDLLYIGRGNREITFSSRSTDSPAAFYFLSYPAHKEYPAKLVRQKDCNVVELGSDMEANQRTLYQAICPGIVETCQIVMGFTVVAPGSVWNTMPPHTHNRRSEIYLYFDMPAGQRVFHFMGQPQETRSLVIANREAVVSPNWSIHCGVGTGSYAFVWCMGGENQEFTDMDGVPASGLR